MPHSLSKNFNTYILPKQYFMNFEALPAEVGSFIAIITSYETGIGKLEWQDFAGL